MINCILTSLTALNVIEAPRLSDLLNSSISESLNAAISFLTVSNEPRIPTPIPSPINLPTESLITLEGECMPKAFLKLLITPVAKPPIFLAIQPTIFSIPFQIPLTIFLPIPSIFEGSEAIAFTMISKIFLAAPPRAPNSDLIPLTNPLIPLPPSARSLSGIIRILISTVSNASFPVPFRNPNSALIPLPRPVIAIFPRLIQLNALHTSTIAVMIFGILTMSVGIAWMIPNASLAISFRPHMRTVGPLSLMIFANVLIIVGIFAIMTGSADTTPSANLFSISKPLFINCGACEAICVANF